jgi:hypothetical protein
LPIADAFTIESSDSFISGLVEKRRLEQIMVVYSRDHRAQGQMTIVDSEPYICFVTALTLMALIAQASGPGTPNVMLMKTSTHLKLRSTTQEIVLSR